MDAVSEHVWTYKKKTSWVCPDFLYSDDVIMTRVEAADTRWRTLGTLAVRGTQ